MQSRFKIVDKSRAENEVVIESDTGKETYYLFPNVSLCKVNWIFVRWLPYAYIDWLFILNIINIKGINRVCNKIAKYHADESLDRVFDENVTFTTL